MSKYGIHGKRFGKLLALQQVEDYVKPGGEHLPQWLCVCECGRSTIVRRQHLLSGHTTSCGCAKPGGKKGNGLKVCVFLPTAIECTNLNCEKCGWNPFNKDLRNRRIAKLKRKDGTDE